MWDYRFWKTNKMASRKWGLLSQKTAKLANLNMGNPLEISSQGIYLQSLKYFALHNMQISERNCCDTPPKQNQDCVLLKINNSQLCMRYAKICLPPKSVLFYKGRCRFRYLYTRSMVCLRWMISPMVVHPEQIDFRRFV